MAALPNIAFIGKAGSGKDTCAELLIEHVGYRRLAFADELKEVAVGLWGEDARKDRDKLQRLGEYVRSIDPNTWVDLALAKIPAKPGGPPATGTADEVGPGPVAVTDCRYKNEAWTLKGEDFVIVRVVCDRNERINRLRTNGKLGPSGWEQHVSETELDDWPEDYRVVNTRGTGKPDLLDQLAQIIKHEQMAD